ncbi:hypothetical protein LINPERPRIM_LOCUS29098 [Linum perenne]
MIITSGLIWMGCSRINQFLLV